MISVYEPADLRVVLGAGRTAEGDVDLAAAAADGVPVRRRRGGGGTVLLTPGQVVLAVVTEVSSPFQNREYAARIGGWVTEALTSLGVGVIEPRGISDLAIRERKILGSSIYRSRLVLFYQASLLVDLDTTLFDRYLRYPSRVPDYRAGRGHVAFCTTVAAEGYRGSVGALIARIDDVARREIHRLL